MNPSTSATLTPEQALEQSVQAASPSSAFSSTSTPAPSAAASSATRRKMPGKTGRSRAREFVVQALYQHLVGGQDAAAIDQFTRALTGFHKGDTAHFDAVFHGCVAQAQALDALIAPHLDRDWREISPIEHACMWIGVYELQHCPDVPWRVVLNECIELTKSFGGTDGHRYVNGILHALSAQLRPLEVQRDQASTRR